jgi:hypothetical protein
MFQLLKKAYFARNGIVHGLRPIHTVKAKGHIQDIENILVWYWNNVGKGLLQTRKDDIPF